MSIVCCVCCGTSVLCVNCEGVLYCVRVLESVCVACVLNVSCVQDVLENMDPKKLIQFKELMDRDGMQGKACTNGKTEGSSSVQSAQGKNMKHFPCTR